MDRCSGTSAATAREVEEADTCFQSLRADRTRAESDEKSIIARVRSELRDAANQRAQLLEQERGRSRARWVTVQQFAVTTRTLAGEHLSSLLKTLNQVESSVQHPVSEVPHATDAAYAETCIQKLQATVDCICRCRRELGRLRQDCRDAQLEVDRAGSASLEAGQRRDAQSQKQKTVESDVDQLEQVVRLLDRKGVRAFAIESALRELQGACNEALNAINEGDLQVELSMSISKPGEVHRAVRFRSAMGDMLPRALAALSAGERRRVGIAFTLALVELASRRGHMTCSLLVLDEALQHIDSRGVRMILAYLNRWQSPSSSSTVLLTSQQFEPAVMTGGTVHVVMKRNGVSKLSTY